MAKRHHVIDLTLEGDSDEEAPVEQPCKVSRHEGVQGGVEPAPSRTALLQQDTPFKLMKIRDGEIPSSFNFGCLGWDLSALLPRAMEFAMVCNMQVDLPWMLGALPGLQTARHLLICHGERGARAALLQEAAQKMQGTLPGGGRIELHAPPIPDEYGKHHSKAFLVQYARGLRVIILTANMVQPDCTVKSQGIWCQDFPPKDAQSPPTSPLQSDLTDYLRHYRLPQQAQTRLLGLLSSHDLSCSRAALVPSVPGWHSGNHLCKYGHMRVRELLSREPLPRGGGDWRTSSHLVLQCSSIGSLDEKWLTQDMARSMSAAARGTAGPNVSPLSAGAAAVVGPSRLHFVWPTVQEVRDSVEGWCAGGSIPGCKKNVEKPFLQRHMARFGGQPAGRQRAMPHIKSYCRFLGQQLAWVLLGSHNLSKAAWGMLCKGDTTLKILSYELGTLFTPSLEAAYLRHRHHGFRCTSPAHAGSSDALPASSSAAQPEVEFWSMDHMLQRTADQPTPQTTGTAGHIASAALATVQVMIPLPYKLPPERYTSGVDQPWMADVIYPGRDILGYTMEDLYGPQA